MPSYPGISSEAFRHPLDQQAEATLRRVPGFDIVASTFVEYFYERPQQIYLMGNNIKVGPRQYSTLYGILRESAQDLSMDPVPALYVSQNPQVNAYALGTEHPYIVMNTGLLELMSEAELRTVIAHELGHIKCEHTLLIQMAMWVMGAASILGELTLGLGSLISTGLIYAFYEWRRKAELSADRAALLVMDDLNPIMHNMMKLAGGSHKYLHECNMQEFINQSKEYRHLDDDSLNQIYKFLIYNGGNGTFITHPFAVERVHYLQEWSTSREYQNIKRGNYAKAPSKGAVNVDNNSEAEQLRRKINELQEQIDRLRSQNR